MAYTPPVGFQVIFDFTVTTPYVAPGGYQVVFDFTDNPSLGTFNAYEGDYAVSGGFPNPFSGQFLAYEGDNWFAALSPWDIYMFGGTGGMSVSLTADPFTPFVNFNFSGGTGGLSPVYLFLPFIVNLWGGTGGSTAVVTNNPFVPFSVLNAWGAEGGLSTPLNTSVLLSPPAYGGEGGTSIVVTSDPFVPFVPFNFAGGEGGEQATLATQYNLPTSQWGGTGGLSVALRAFEQFSVNYAGGTGGITAVLSTFINTLPNVNAVEGHNTAADLHTQPPFTPFNMWGEEGGLSPTLQITAGLQSPQQGGTGGITVALTTNPFVPFVPFNFAGGEGGWAWNNFSPTYNKPQVPYEGATFVPTLTPGNKAFFTPSIVEGAETFLNLSVQWTAFNVSYSGGTGGLTVISIGNVPNIYAYGGPGGLQVTLGTTQTLYPSGFAGGAAGFSPTVTVFPPPLFYPFPNQEGDVAVVSLSGVMGAHLAVTFGSGFDFRLGIPWVGTDFTMELLPPENTCCPVINKGTYFSFDMGDGLWDEPDLNYGPGYKQVVLVDLQTRPRFSPSFVEGQTAIVRNVFATVQPSFQDGAQCTAALETIYNIRLCPGNFIPDASNVVIELINAYDDSCFNSTNMVAGETMRASLQENLGMQGLVCSATNGLQVTLTPDPKLTFLAWEGALCRVSNPEFTGNCYGGTGGMTYRMQEPTFAAYEGCNLASFSIATEYFIAFDEFGCVINEYIPQNENGDPVPGLYNPVPVELEIFQHQIKTHCF